MTSKEHTWKIALCKSFDIFELIDRDFNKNLKNIAISKKEFSGEKLIGLKVYLVRRCTSNVPITLRQPNGGQEKEFDLFCTIVLKVFAILRASIL